MIPVFCRGEKKKIQFVARIYVSTPLPRSHHPPGETVVEMSDTAKGARERETTDFDKSLGALQKMLPALRLGALLVPVNDGLVGNTVLIIQNFENLGKRLDDARVFITIHLYDIDEGNFGLGTVAERLQDGGIFLGRGSVGKEGGEYTTRQRTPTSRRARPSI